MALLTAQQTSLNGTAPTYSAVTSSDTLALDSRTVLHVKNASGSSINVTVPVPGLDHGNTRSSVVVAVPAGGDRFIGPFDVGLIDMTTGLVTVNYSATTSVTAALVRV